MGAAGRRRRRPGSGADRRALALVMLVPWVLLLAVVLAISAAARLLAGHPGEALTGGGPPAGDGSAGARKVVLMASGTDGRRAAVEVRAEVADTDPEREKGLMGRPADSLDEDAGMLFDFGQERDLTFWMRDTPIPLSVAFVDSEGRIVDVQDMKAMDDEPPHYTSAEPARYALEVNRGFFEERGVEVGDRVAAGLGVPRPDATVIGGESR